MFCFISGQASELLAASVHMNDFHFVAEWRSKWHNSEDLSVRRQRTSRGMEWANTSQDPVDRDMKNEQVITANETGEWAQSFVLSPC